MVAESLRPGRRALSGRVPLTLQTPYRIEDEGTELTRCVTSRVMTGPVRPRNMLKCLGVT